MISFEAEDFEGPDDHINEIRTDFLRSLIRAKVDYTEQSTRNIDDELKRFKQYFQPQQSEEDVADDEFELPANEATEDRSKVMSVTDVKASGSLHFKMSQMSERSIIVRKSMF